MTVPLAAAGWIVPHIGRHIVLDAIYQFLTTGSFAGQSVEARLRDLAPLQEPNSLALDFSIVIQVDVAGTGIDEVDEELRARLNTALENAANKIRFLLKEKVKAAAPVRTGALEKALEVRVNTIQRATVVGTLFDHELVVTVSGMSEFSVNPVFYMPIVNDLTGFVTADAIPNTEPLARQIVAAEITSILS